MNNIEKVVVPVEHSAEWREKIAADADRNAQQKLELQATPFERATMLTGLLPASVVGPGNITMFLTEGEKAAILAYAFIGLSELVSGSSGQPMSFIWKSCLERGIHNLRKDGLLT